MVLSYKEGRFFLSVPLFVDEKTIEAFLQANASWIQEKRESKVKEGDTVFLFDRSYHVCFADQSWIKDDTLFYDPQSWLSFLAHFARPRLRQEFEETRKKIWFSLCRASLWSLSIEVGKLHTFEKNHCVEYQARLRFKKIKRGDLCP